MQPYILKDHPCPLRRQHNCVGGVRYHLPYTRYITDSLLASGCPLGCLCVVFVNSHKKLLTFAIKTEYWQPLSPLECLNRSNDPGEFQQYPAAPADLPDQHP